MILPLAQIKKYGGKVLAVTNGRQTLRLVRKYVEKQKIADLSMDKLYNRRVKNELQMYD